MTTIATTAFEAELRRDGYDEIARRDMAPDFAAETHVHDFDVRLLMLTGQLTLTRDGAATTYRAGESFVMDAGCPHAEQFGPEGSSYLVGRRHAKG